MILEQHYLACLAQASYLVGDAEAGVACVVDPRRDVEPYLERAAELGVRITHVLLTHFHADFLAGHLELVARTGATLCLGARAEPDFPFTPLADGEELTFGAVRLRCLHTPGHTPESVCYLVFDGADASGGAEPTAVLTGDTLFLGDVGRPDLTASRGVTREDLAGMLYDSLHAKLLPLPDGVTVYPGHGAGSACGKSLSSATSGSLGDQRRTNYALQPMDRAAFVAAVTEGLSAPPAYFPFTAALNRGQHADLAQVREQSLTAHEPQAFRAAREAGAQVLDVRPKDAFAAGHLPGSLWVGLEGNFASWAGSVLDLERPTLLVADPGDEAEAVTRLGRIGYDGVVGHLAGGGARLAEVDAPLAVVRRVDPAEARRLAESGAARVLDVRGPGEYEAGHVAGAHNACLKTLGLDRGAAPAADDRPLLVHCKSGYRSLVALALLEAEGRTDLVDVAGGFDAWEAAGLPVVVEAGASA